MKHFLLKSLLAIAVLCAGSGSVWAQDSTPVYFNDFSSTDGLTIQGTGSFTDDGDTRFGQVFSNAASALPRSNYLLLPSTVFSDFTDDGGKTAMTISFWVTAKNAGAANAYTYAPLFAAYSAAPNPTNGSPMICLPSRGTMQINNNGWCDFAPAQNKDGKNTIYNTNAWEVDGNHTSENTSGGNWLDDSNWHLYTMTLTASQATIYLDGVLKNQWNLDGSVGQDVSGMFTKSATNLTYVCLGGNQAWDWGDNDAAFMFDDFAVYDAALSADQIRQIIANKLHYTVNAVDGSSNVLKVLADANSNANTVDVAYPRYILDGSTLREATATSSKYTKTYTLTSGNQVENIEYTYSSVPYVYYYAEGEDVLTNNRTYEAQSLSMNKIGYTANSSTFTSLITLPAGTWTIKARYFCGNKTGAHNAYIKVGEEVKWSQEYADGAGGNAEKASAEFTLTSPAVISVAADGGSATGFDWFYITGTPSYTVIGETDNSTYYLTAMTNKVVLAPGQSWHYKFVNYNSGTGGNHNNWVLPVYNSSDENKIVVRSDFWEDNDKAAGHEWGSNAGCTATIVWDNYVANMNGAAIDMKVSFTADKKFIMTSTISPSDGSADWTYSYTSDYTDSPYDFTSDDYIKVALSVSNSWLGLEEEGPAVTLGDLGWATLYTPYALDFSGVDGLTAYTATLSDNTVTLTEVDNVPANTGVVLNGAAGSYNIPTVASSATAQGELTGNATESTAFDAVADHTYYVLAPSEDANYKVQFRPVTSGSIAAGKAFLDVASAGVKAFNVVLNDLATGINELANGQQSMANGPIFNLAGQRVDGSRFTVNGSGLKTGIYIVNGKKVLVK